jgi:hypothetical protein
MLDITTLAAWGELLGGIGVVISLVYLASQIRQNSKLLRASTTAASYEPRLVHQSLIASDPEVARIFHEGSADRGALSESDRRQFDALIGMVTHVDQQQYQFYLDGVGSDRAWEALDASMRRKLAWRGFREWWPEWSDAYPRWFRDYVDGLIREGEAAE